MTVDIDMTTNITADKQATTTDTTADEQATTTDITADKPETTKDMTVDIDIFTYTFKWSLYSFILDRPIHEHI